LLGTPDDYQKLKEKVDKLTEYDLGNGILKKWHAMLSPIFEELINSSKGTPNLDFWNKICHYHGGGSGPRYLSGWISVFCCFDENGKWQGDTGEKEWPFINTNDIPCGIVSVPVDVDGVKTMMFAGSFCMNVVSPTKVEPRLDWSITLIDNEALNKKENKKSDFY